VRIDMIIIADISYIQKHIEYMKPMTILLILSLPDSMVETISMVVDLSLDFSQSLTCLSTVYMWPRESSNLDIKKSSFLNIQLKLSYQI